MKQEIVEAVEQLDQMLQGVHWHMPLPNPDLTVTMIEAKAKLLEARKKLMQIQEVLP